MAHLPIALESVSRATDYVVGDMVVPRDKHKNKSSTKIVHRTHLMWVNSLDSSCLEEPNPSDLKNLLPFLPPEGSEEPPPPPLPIPAEAASLLRPASVGTDAVASCAVLCEARQRQQIKAHAHPAVISIVDIHQANGFCAPGFSDKET